MSDPSSPTDDARSEPAETPRERAEEIYEDVGAENPDPVTRREAIEGELAHDDGASTGEQELDKPVDPPVQD